MLLCPALWHPVLSFGAPVAPPCPRRVVLLWRPIVTQWRSVTPCGGHRPRNNLTVRMGRQRAAQKKNNILTNKNPTTTHIASTTQTPPTTNNQLSAAHKQQQHTATTTNNRHAQQHTQQGTNKQTNTQRQTNAHLQRNTTTSQQQQQPKTQRNATTTEPCCGLFAALRGASGTFKFLRPRATPSVSSSAFVAFVGGVLGHFSCGAHK